MSGFTINSPLFKYNWVTIHHSENKVKWRFTKLIFFPMSCLEDRREFKDKILLFKCLHGMSFITLQDGVKFRGTDSISLRSSGSPTIIPNKCNTNIFKQTFFLTVCTTSKNDLSADIRNVQFFQCFKSELLNHYITNYFVSLSMSWFYIWLLDF